MDILAYMPWIWLGLFALLVVIEAATQGLTTIWGAASALVMVVLSYVTAMPVGWQVFIFLVITLILLLTTRPVLIKKMKIGKTNVDSLIGQEVVVTKAITKFEKGLAKTKNGVVWTSKSKDDEDIPEKAVCVIDSVEGNTLTLERKG